MSVIIGKTRRHKDLIDVSTPHTPQDIDTSLPYNFSSTSSTFAGVITSQFIGTATSTLYGDGSQLTGLPGGGGGGGIGGSGTANYIPVWTDSTTLGTSSFVETGGSIGTNVNIAAKSFSPYINVATITSDITLVPGQDAMYQFLSTGGADRNVTLSTTNAKPGDRFVIKNINYASNDDKRLVILQGASTLDVLRKDKVVEFVFDGSRWIGGCIGYTPFENSVNVAIGYNTRASLNGVAVGHGASGDNHGVAVGYGANGGAGGIAVGYGANGGSGVAVGYNANGGSGVAIGPYANASNGLAIGYYADGSNFGLAVGYYAVGSNYGVAIGRNAVGSNSGVAVGYYAKGYNRNISIGYYAGYLLTSGSFNIIIGDNAGNNASSSGTFSPTTGMNNILIGRNAWTPNATTSNFLNIGGLLFGTNIGNTAGSIAMGNIGIRTANPNTALHVEGAIALGITLITTSSTLDDKYSIILADASSGDIFIDLPDATTCKGRIYWIKRTDGTSNIMQVRSASGQYIDGGNTISLSQNHCYGIACYNGNWYIISKYVP